MGKVSRAKKKKKKPGGAGEKIKLQTKKNRDEGEKKKLGRGRGENKVAKKNRRSGLRKGKQKKVNLGWHRDRKENPILAPSIHVGALVGSWFTLSLFNINNCNACEHTCNGRAELGGVPRCNQIGKDKHIMYKC